MPDNCDKCIHFGNSSGKCRHPEWPLKRLKQDHNIYESRAKCCPFKEHAPQHIGNCVNACAGLGADPAARIKDLLEAEKQRNDYRAWRDAHDEGEVAAKYGKEPSANPYPEPCHAFCGWTFGYWSQSDKDNLRKAEQAHAALVGALLDAEEQRDKAEQAHAALLSRLESQVIEWAGRTGDVNACAGLGADPAARIAELLEAEKQRDTDRIDHDGWHKIVIECENIFGCADTAENPWSSNLPNLIRDLMFIRLAGEEEKGKRLKRERDKAEQAHAALLSRLESQVIEWAGRTGDANADLRIAAGCIADILREHGADKEPDVAAPEFDPTAKPIWETVVAIGAKIPESEWDKVPRDLSTLCNIGDCHAEIKQLRERLSKYETILDTNGDVLSEPGPLSPQDAGCAHCGGDLVMFCPQCTRFNVTVQNIEPPDAADPAVKEKQDEC